ncbi:hypothetical protein GW17_00058151, partial [Ensete ventricosum]
GTTKILDTEMDHNGIRNHPQHDPQLSSALNVLLSMISGYFLQELLALEERIGNVCTGLSEETILRCMGEMVYHSNYIQEEGLCAICLVKTISLTNVLLQCPC